MKCFSFYKRGLQDFSSNYTVKRFAFWKHHSFPKNYAFELLCKCNVGFQFYCRVLHHFYIQDLGSFLGFTEGLLRTCNNICSSWSPTSYFLHNLQRAVLCSISLTRIFI